MDSSANYPISSKNSSRISLCRKKKWHRTSELRTCRPRRHCVLRWSPWLRPSLHGPPHRVLQAPPLTAPPLCDSTALPFSCPCHLWVFVCFAFSVLFSLEGARLLVLSGKGSLPKQIIGALYFLLPSTDFRRLILQTAVNTSFCLRKRPLGTENPPEI